MTALRRYATILTAFAVALWGCVLVAAPAFARPPDPERVGVIVSPGSPAIAQVSYGSPMWVFLLVAAASVAATIALGVLGLRLWRQQGTRQLVGQDQLG